MVNATIQFDRLSSSTNYDICINCEGINEICKQIKTSPKVMLIFSHRKNSKTILNDRYYHLIINLIQVITKIYIYTSYQKCCTLFFSQLIFKRYTFDNIAVFCLIHNNNNSCIYTNCVSPSNICFNLFIFLSYIMVASCVLSKSNTAAFSCRRTFTRPSMRSTGGRHNPTSNSNTTIIDNVKQIDI